MPAAALIPAAPNGAKFAKRSDSNAVNAITANITSTPSLMITITAFTAADSLAPRISNMAHSITRKVAGRLMIPGSVSQGAAENACGRACPRKFSKSLLTY